MRSLIAFVTAIGLTGCGVVYKSPSINSFLTEGSKVRVISMTAETVQVANRSSYNPKTLPAIFSMTSGGLGSMRGVGALPEPGLRNQIDPQDIETRLPPQTDPGPYRIGVGDVVLLATPQVGNSVEQLTGLLAAQNARQGYTVQDDGAIAIPNVGRVDMAGLTLEDAEAVLFQRLVENQIDPSFSLEISEFNSKRVSIGGAVQQPTVVPITLTPLYLDEALAAAGGTTMPDMDYATIRIYRNGSLYQLPLTQLYSDTSLQRIRILDGDSIFIDTSYKLDMAQSYFEEQIRLAEYRQDARVSALAELNAEMTVRRAEADELRDNYLTRSDLGAVDLDYVYLAGEVGQQNRFALPYEQRATLADALYSNDGVPTRTGNVSQIYVLRASDDPREFGAVTAWRLDATNAGNLLLATRFELRPNDVVFVSEQLVTRWNRVVDQIVPSLITTPVTATLN